MKVNPFKNPRLKADPKMNAFPLSHTESFTAPFGALLPVAFYHVAPKTKFRVDMENQTIMTPIIRPPFSRMFEHFEFFAVPMAQLHQAFDNFVTSQSTYENSAVMYFNQDSADEQVGLGHIPSAVPTFTGSLLENTLYSLQTKDDVFGCSKLYNACRLLDLLGYGNFYEVATNGLDAPSEVSGSSGEPQTYMRNLIPMNFYNLLAYQKIYYSHYCNTKYESVETHAFNIDDMRGLQQVNAANIARFEKMLQLHYRWKSRDYFTCVQPNVLPDASDFGFRDISSIPYGAVDWQVFGVPGNAVNWSNDFPLVDDDSGRNGSSFQGSMVNVGDEISVSSIRFAFAYDKLLRRMRAAGSDFNSQMLAQFGITPSDKRHGAAKYLGGYTNQLRFDEVTSTADSGASPVGDIAGKLSAYNQNRRTIEYEAQENTIIMCIYSTSLDLQYHSFNQSRENLRRFRFDWFNEAFQNLGLQPLFMTEYSYISDQQDREKQAYMIQSTTDLKQIIGFIPRYLEYKTKVNRVHGLLQWPYNNPDGKSWVVQNSDQYHTNSSDPDEVWKTLNCLPMALPNLVYNPFTLNDNITTPYNGSWNTDHFNVFSYFNARVVAPMSAYGEDF